MEFQFRWNSRPQNRLSPNIASPLSNNLVMTAKTVLFRWLIWITITHHLLLVTSYSKPLQYIFFHWFLHEYRYRLLYQKAILNYRHRKYSHSHSYSLHILQTDSTNHKCCHCSAHSTLCYFDAKRSCYFYQR